MESATVESATVESATVESATVESATMESATMESATMEPAIEVPAEAMMEVAMKALEMAEAIAAVEPVAEEERPADEERRPEDPRVIPIVRVGIGRRIDRLRRQRVGQRRLTGRALGNPPTAVRLLARLPDRLLRLPADHDRSGERAAIRRNVALSLLILHRQGGRGERRGLRHRQSRHRRNTQKGMRIGASYHQDRYGGVSF
jgi:hypothetical protein